MNLKSLYVFHLCLLSCKSLFNSSHAHSLVLSISVSPAQSVQSVGIHISNYKMLCFLKIMVLKTKHQNGPNGSKQFKTIQKSSKVSKWYLKKIAVQNNAKLSNKVRMVQCGLIWTNIVQKFPKWSETIQHGPKQSKIFQHRSKQFKMVKIGQKYELVKN